MPGPPPPTASCYICLEDGADSNNQPLLRNCACRGDAGWAHVACLAEFAATKITEAQRNNGFSNSITIASFWEKCPLCKTSYMQYMGVAMAEAFVKQYKHLPDTHALRYSSLYSLGCNRHHNGDQDGALGLFVRLQETCDILTSEGIDVRRVEANNLGMIGAVSVQKNQFNDALVLLERQRELCVAVDGPNSQDVQDCNDMIAAVKERIRMEEGGHQNGDPAAELVAARQNFKECREETTEPEKRFGSYLSLIFALRNVQKYQECMEISDELLAKSRQTLGPDHPDTLRYENAANLYRQKVLQSNTSMASNSSAAGVTASEKKDVWAVIDCEQQPAISGQRVQVLRATKDAHKYVCLIKNDKGVSTKFKVAPNQFILETGTTVVVHGLVSSTDLNGSIGRICSFDKEKRRYAVSVEIKKTSVSIKPINLNIVFD